MTSNPSTAMPRPAVDDPPEPVAGVVTDAPWTPAPDTRTVAVWSAGSMTTHDGANGGAVAPVVVVADVVAEVDVDVVVVARQ